ncbi:MAG: phytanoyl-CoA dioxygenase family protein [Pseudomonadota bacterium]
MDIKTDFDKNGFCLAHNVFSETDLEHMESAFDRIVYQLKHSGENIDARWRSANTDKIDGGTSQVIHTHNVHRYCATWLSAITDARFLDHVEHIIGPDIVLHHNKLFEKPPREGSPFPIHQDWWYFPTERDSMMAAVIFLGDANDECGGFRVYPGSHRLGRLPNSSGLYESDALSDYPLEGATAINAVRGDVLFFSYFLLHGSTPNRSDNTRKSVLVQLYSGNDRVLPNLEVNHANEQLVLRGWNHGMSRALASE